ncbi:hypothetical protein EHQ27_17170 [Leptospira wolffii]|uniref:hypothetical protein n=1 Tax=Leptospira wolffii TaxID=409998 RepID=UPI00108347DE|nr:hypothetical protein [Leptospira wolffii]TGK58246.1 hypothetical protein EHQ32_13215 [Leptospira wolffii]TGK66378.1 hypothetical protein EHQ27_17170 [Leptospira wolffii]TGK68924.1 hypothetical protein EHQ35_19085 [Leptospira wolffii]TGL27276.1 hypothetical protein EHQ57_17065 [Leptospira wolffii]
MRVLGISLLFISILFLNFCRNPEPDQTLDLLLIEWIDNYPNIEKGACPGNEVVNIFPPGTHSVSLTAGERYYFNLTIAYGTIYQISYNEDPGVDISSSTLFCTDHPGADLFPAANDSGSSGQAESVIVALGSRYPRMLGVLVSTADITTNITLPSTVYSN